MGNKNSYLSKLIITIIVSANILGFPVSASSFAQENTGDSDFEKIIESIEDKYKVSITVDADAISQKEEIQKKISDNSEKILNSDNIDEALKLFTSGTNLQYEKLRDDFYIIKLEEGATNVVPEKKNKFEGEKKKIKGNVTQKSDGSTLPGVNVFVKGTTIGVATDIDGNFVIDVPEDANTLVFSFLGFKILEITIDDQSTINAQLEEDVFGLEEVIVAGVASETPIRNLSVSVTRVDEKVIKEVPAYSAAGALQGKVAGVNVIHANGLPGSGAAIRIRGSTSLIGNQRPMILLDGNILYTNLADINTDDIESVEVVKGAAAAALYGSKAGNGVIVINTKRGKGKGTESTSVIFRQEVGFQQLAKQIELSEHHPYKLAEDWKEYPYTRYDGIW